MAQAQKVTGKDLKQLRQPDEFQVVAGKGLEWILANQKTLGLAVVGIVAIALIAWGATVYKGRNESKAGEALAEALRLEARTIAGEGFAQPGEETFATRAERTKASTDALEKVRSEHAGSVAAQTATLQLGLLKQQTGESAAAVPLLEQFLKDAGNGHPMRATALEALGYAQEATGKMAEARESFGKLKDAGAESRGAYQLARLSLIENKPDAKAQLEKVGKDYPKEAVGQEANMRLEVAALPPAPATPAAPADAAPAAPAPKTAKSAPKGKPAKKGK